MNSTITKASPSVRLDKTKVGYPKKANKRAFSLTRRAAFYTDIAAFMSYKLPPFQALQDMQVIASKRRSTRGLALIYRSLISSMEHGASLSVAMSKLVPGAEAVMLVGAEQAGQQVLQEAFKELGTLLSRQQKVRRKLRGALIANGLTIGAILGMVVFITNLVVPQLAAGITKDMLPRLGFSLGFFAFGRSLMNFGPFVFAALGAVGALIAWSMSRWTINRRWWSRRWFDRHLMPWTLYVRAQSTFFLSSAASMMRAGIPLPQVVTDMVPYASPWMRKHLRSMLKILEAGRSETEALGCGLLPEDTSDRLRIYQRLPDFTEIMTLLSENNFTRFEDSIDGLSASMRICGTLILGVFIISLLFAIFDYTNALYDSVSAARAMAGGG